MKSLSITQARRRLGELVCTPETVEITRRGQRIGEIRGVEPEAPDDRERAMVMAAARRIREIGMTRKPSKTHGGAQAIRRLRDHGR